MVSDFDNIVQNQRQASYSQGNQVQISKTGYHGVSFYYFP